jgi:MFS family permease
MLALLHQRNFALLWFGGLISLTGDWLLYAALPFYVYQQTHSTLATAALVAAELVPNFLLGSIAGVFVDRWDRKRVMVVANVLQTGVVLLLLVRSAEWVWLVYLVSIVQTAIGTFFSPAENALLPRLVPEEQLLPANALNSLNNNLARLIGPPIGGLLLSIGGLYGVVLLDSASFLTAAVLIGLLTMPGSARKASPHHAADAKDVWGQFWTEWLDGLRLARRERLITALFIVLVLMNFGGVMIDPLYPAFVSDVLRAGPQAFGWLLTTWAVGGLLGGLVVGKLGKAVRPTRLLGWCSIIGGVMVLAQFNVPALSVALATSFLLGPPNVASRAAAQTLLQRWVPDAYLGRVIGALDTTIAIASLVSVVGLAGALSEIVGLVPMLNVAVALNILAGVLALVILPSSERQDMPSEASDQETTTARECCSSPRICGLGCNMYE